MYAYVFLRDAQAGPVWVPHNRGIGSKQIQFPRHSGHAMTSIQKRILVDIRFIDKCKQP